MTTQHLRKPVPLEKEHDVLVFDCGEQRLNDYLRKYALTNHQNRAARTYVSLRGRGDRVIGFYTLAAGSVGREQTPRRVAHGLGQYPLPVIVLARLAVDVSEQGRGVGSGLVKDALVRVLQAADIIGVRALLVHAKDQTARAFYMRFGFESSPINELHLYLLMKDIQKTITG